METLKESEISSSALTIDCTYYMGIGTSVKIKKEVKVAIGTDKISIID